VQKETLLKQIDAAQKAYEAGDIQGAYDVIKGHDDHKSPAQVDQSIMMMRGTPSASQAVKDWLNLAITQLRRQLGIDSTEQPLGDWWIQCALRGARSVLKSHV